MYVAIDLGGTRCRVLTTHTLDQVQRIDRHEFVLSHVFETDVQSLIDTIRRFVGNERIEAIGFGVPGNLDPEKTRFADPSVNLLEWADKPIKDILTKEFNCPVFLENDGATAALSEAYFGLGKGKDFCFVIWGTGIGGASVKHVGKHLHCEPFDWYKYFESWEEACGGNKILEHYSKEASELTEAEWQSVMGDFRTELSQFIQATATENIVFGGGIAIRQQERLLTLAREFPDVSIQVSHLGEDAGLYGALALIKGSYDITGIVKA